MEQYLRYRLGPHAIRFLRMVWTVIWRTLVKYDETDGEQRAASFAYYAFFSLFPLVLLLISIGTAIVGNKEIAAQAVIGYVEKYLPVDIEPGRANMVLDTINGVVRSRNKAGVIAFAVLAWTALRFFQALVRGVNRAWGMREYSWWRLPIQNLFMVLIVAGAVFLGIFVPMAINLIEEFYWKESWMVGLDFSFAKDAFEFLRYIVPALILFYAFSVFYRVAPRRRTQFREVWIAALMVTFGLQGLQKLFLIYTRNITDFNRLYGALGSVVAVLLWIYLSGSLIILGGCLSAAQWEVERHLTDQAEKSRAA